MEIIADSVDDLVLKGIKHIKDNGDYTEARGLSGLQCFNVSYRLTNPLNRVHTLRAPKSIRYFARELIAYCKGSLNVEELARAARVWESLADEDGKIYSNYGYYTFRQYTPDRVTQFEWVSNQLKINPSSRRCVIIIDNINAKREGSKDIPCTLGMHFFVEKEKLCAAISMRSTDIITGLPYDMGFYSFVQELLWRDLQNVHPHIGLGYCIVKSNLTQLYDSRDELAAEVENGTAGDQRMPDIIDAKSVLNDIYNDTYNSEPMSWLYNKSEYET